MAVAARPELSVVTDYGENGSSCGYCGKKAASSLSHGMMAESLSVECYQELVDRGWRRSGSWLYCPVHERCCCQLLTIRLDVTRFAPNKDQRRVHRKWQAYLSGAPLRADEQKQQLGEQLGEQQQQQQHEEPAGGSPKRPHGELASDLMWGQALEHEEQQQQQQQQEAGISSSAQDERGGKRLRHAGSRHSARGHGQEKEMQEGEEPARNGCGGGDEDEDWLRGSSPTAQLRSQLQHALRSNLMPPGDEATAQKQQQQQQQGQVSAPVRQQDQLAVPMDEVQLASRLAAALQAAVAGGQLPAAAYPPPKVQQPTAKQRKQLPPAVTFTSGFPLAVAAAASKVLAGAGGGGRHSPEEAAAVLLQHLPSSLTAAIQIAKGHLNLSVGVAASGAAGAKPPSTSHSMPGKAEASGRALDGLGKQHEGQQLDGQQPQAGQAQHNQQQQDQPLPNSAAPAGAVPRGVPRHFELRTLPSSQQGLPEVEFPLWKKYQAVHHGDKPSELTMRSFKRFLVDSPLRHTGPAAYAAGACPPCGFGSFHQQYWLDGRLVAVGVVDVLPHCLSSVYLFWDTDMAPLSLGKLTSLKEIEWVRELQGSCPSLRYYYLGFYIHNCHRMRYKGDFGPSDLLCPKNKCWVPLDRVRGALEQPGMVPISELPGALQGLGQQHLVDPATSRPTCPPREPDEEELGSLKVIIQPHGQRKPRMLPLRALLEAGGDSLQMALVAPLKLWWSRVGAAAAAHTAVVLG